MPMRADGRRKRLADEPFTRRQRDLIATIVHNAGIYNGILAAGLVWAALTATRHATWLGCSLPARPSRGSVVR